MPGNRIVIAVDFGTTYSGVAICETSDDGTQGRQIEVLRNYPSCHTKIGTKDKVPSEIAYLKDGVEWGSNIPTHEGRYMWMKLQLDRRHSGEAAKIMREMFSAGAGPSKKPVDIIADFLRCLKEHILKNLDEMYGEGLWKSLPIVLVITVPAVWSDLAKNRTMSAFEKAGFNNKEIPQLAHILTTTEPEAAAIFTIKTLRGGAHDEQLTVGDGFVVCDMGGGTADLISYKVTALQPTVVEEATVGNGDQCGSTFVDRAFIQLLEDKIGVEEFIKMAGCRASEVPHTKLSQKLARILGDFVMEAKTGFSGKQYSFLRLPHPLSNLPDDESKGIQDGEIRLTPTEMVKLFDFCIKRTCELIDEQLEQATCHGEVEIKYVFLVGGFAESAYVYSEISAFAKKKGITVIRPAYAWSAVVRGAAAKGLEIDNDALVKNRKCRRHYGTAATHIFVAGVHPQSDLYTCPFTGDKRADNCMEWLIQKGQSLSTSASACTKLPLCLDFWMGEDRTANLKLLASNHDVAAARSVHSSIFTVATLQVDLSNVPNSEFTLHHSSTANRLYHRLNFNVEISVQGSLEFSLSVKGNKYGAVKASYEA
ncbi:hypothetical protein FB567DRAFT_487211 [Paraphoma chrysanthemicola]|uniref:Actin-like ATPase domain-containing protein n=1 Tax=Paraphoma chrysanthemicola TaxID=798071 RepID=A0A8K0W348_9PLEO|nr:hypothetical protein FB567DRAFT_487211 [Paraphoma chrysanthemicola]